MTSDITQETAAQLPRVNAMKRTIRNIRLRNDCGPALPVSRKNIVVPEEYSKTSQGKNFILFDSGPTDDRMLIFGTRNIQLLGQSNH